MKTTLLSTFLVVLTSCSTSQEIKAPPASRPPAEARKPGAPTELESQLKERSAVLSLRFEGAGENVSVLVSGIEGVATSSAELMAGASVKAGEVRRFDVPFTRGGTGGHLVISVEGTFAGGRKARVHTVAIGDGTDLGAGVLQVTNDGDGVKEMPSQAE